MSTDTKRVALGLALTVVVSALPVLVLAGPALAVTVPAEGVSYYVQTNVDDDLYDLGCSLGTLDASRPGTQHPIVHLEFGGPTTVAGTYGATLYNGPNSTLAQILAAAKGYAEGYWVCVGADLNSVAEVAIGTNTSTSASSITYAAGRAWAQMVNSFASWLGTVLYGSQVIAAGGNDIETSWAAPSVARSWVDGYASVYTRRLLNTGSVDGCSWTGIPGSECNGSWLPEDVYHVSWGSPPAWAVPEIYRTDGRQAQQWYWMARYAVQAHGSTMLYAGSSTQRRECGTGCSGLNNTVAAGYTQLYNALAQNAATAQTPAGATDFAGYTRDSNGKTG